MKRICSVFVVAFLLFACNKNDTPKAEVANIEFKLNGNPLQWDFTMGVPGKSVFLAKYPSLYGGSIYKLEANNASQQLNFALALYTDTLTAGTYTTPLPGQGNYVESSLLQNGTVYSLMAAGDSTEVIITSINNQKASGTFKASMRQFNGSQTLTITEGSFTGVRILD